MLLFALVCSLSLAAMGQQVDDDWVDPYDMLNYDASTKTMKKPTEPANYNNVATKRREYTQDSSQAELALCNTQAADLQKQVEDQKKTIALISQQATCNPVFKRFLSRLLKAVQKLGVPSDSSDVYYDAKIRLSRQAMTEIQTLLEGEDGCRTGALDSAISQILVDLRPHDYEAWKWNFEDTFGVELDTVLKIGLCVLIIMATISTQLWSTVSWFMQFRRLFAVCFFISIVWNWFYLYKIAFAEHQNNIVKMDSVNEKCTGMKKIDWSDSLREWFRSTWTLQDDPCKRYYEVLMVNPILLVPPTKAISVTITTFITEPLKHFGQGISEFLRALLKDLPVTLQIPVLLTIVLSILVFMYGSVQAAFQHGITAPLRRRDPPQPLRRRIEGRNHLARGDAPQQQLEGADEGEHSPSTDLDSEDQLEAQEEPSGASASSVAANAAQTRTKPTRSDLSQSKDKALKKNERRSQEQPSRDDAVLRHRPARRRPSQTDVQDLEASAEDRTSSLSPTHTEGVSVPVQETCQLPEE
ncbi:chloride channel CLIC-like protein 1 [Toxotes jaculatrix]|uniref:chloride channel CLIC-like protein 1 n=1 Tax=Toxotes jaculatrix TaxID=941984 RepID=UPI001B3A9BF2|nr:chloride channel CLIC-like protein 1 [Toxotes jaculatrix]XP_040896007.1 chloride channel CLIC-like protein 1 [Toxotes jaculatrix]XP_040896008.1 chloride channel CLIC-like protein 1 [Toxotes jaculatrix]XP_040896009.1 chloride channel CLIC-like protein 1 [Toxotes jaculatrix]